MTTALTAAAEYVGAAPPNVLPTHESVPRRRRVAVVSASYGAGHDRAAAEIARRFRSAGDLVRLHDLITLAPVGIGRALRQTYYAQLRLVPRSWESTLRRLEPEMAGHRLVTSALHLLTSAVTRAVADADLVVTTHPFASQALGHARESHVLAAPVVTYLTDSSVHPLWVHPGVDLHAALHPVAAGQARRWGGTTVVVQPAVPRPDPGAPPAGLTVAPARPLVALLTAGSLGIGDIASSVADVLACPGWTPVVLCGSNAALRRRLARRPGALALGWRDDVPALMRRADCVIDNAGGFSSLEALASGTPVVSYRPLPGHGRANAVAMDRAGLTTYVEDARDLRSALDAVRAAPRADRLPRQGPTLVEAVGALLPLRAAPVPAGRS